MNAPCRQFQQSILSPLRQKLGNKKCAKNRRFLPEITQKTIKKQLKIINKH